MQLGGELGEGINVQNQENKFMNTSFGIDTMISIGKKKEK